MALSTLPENELFEIRSTAWSGRGVFARQPIAAGTTVYVTDPCSVHVIYRIFRREVCNWCWAYDNGQTYKITSDLCPQAAYFCSDGCKELWERDVGSLGCQAWDKLEAWLRKAGKAEDEPADAPRLSVLEVDDAWIKAVALGALVVSGRRRSTSTSKAERKALLRAHGLAAHDDVLSFLLSAIIAAHTHPTSFALLRTLEAVEVPYRCAEHLAAHTDSFLVLLALLPIGLLSSAAEVADIIRTVARADAHNSFGIWSGPGGVASGSGEMLGYGTWPDASFFNHSCAPILGARVREGRAWKFVTSRDVDMDEEMTISYLSAEELKETDVTARRAVLERAWGFRCRCARCVEESGDGV
ncbi:SET domain-containing protein [Exidia glandulosa HHB12029]|uniref:SET domain-containing protein n=1 Tax=Exidia glandulosa HHB12029 TaxID=1314781 RepID=A0A165E3L2_EXIGL|nr:SET domain-containing protein [Exidia glandulosa HHB12029]